MHDGFIIAKLVLYLLLILVSLVGVSVSEFHRSAVGMFHDLICCYSWQMFQVFKIRRGLNGFKGAGQMTVATELGLVARDLGEEVGSIGTLFELFPSGVGILRTCSRRVLNGYLSSNKDGARPLLELLWRVLIQVDIHVESGLHHFLFSFHVVIAVFLN